MSPASPHSYAAFCVYALRPDKNAIFIYFFLPLFTAILTSGEQRELRNPI